MALTYDKAAKHSGGLLQVAGPRVVFLPGSAYWLYLSLVFALGDEASRNKWSGPSEWLPLARSDCRTVGGRERTVVCSERVVHGPYRQSYKVTDMGSSPPQQVTISGNFRHNQQQGSWTMEQANLTARRSLAQSRLTYQRGRLSGPCEAREVRYAASEQVRHAVGRSLGARAATCLHLANANQPKLYLEASNSGRPVALPVKILAKQQLECGYWRPAASSLNLLPLLRLTHPCRNLRQQ